MLCFDALQAYLQQDGVRFAACTAVLMTHLGKHSSLSVRRLLTPAVSFLAK